MHIRHLSASGFIFLGYHVVKYRIFGEISAILGRFSGARMRPGTARTIDPMERRNRPIPMSLKDPVRLKFRCAFNGLRWHSTGRIVFHHICDIMRCGTRQRWGFRGRAVCKSPRRQEAPRQPVPLPCSSTPPGSMARPSMLFSQVTGYRETARDAKGLTERCLLQPAWIGA